MEHTETISVSSPSAICGCVVEQTLTEGHTYLGTGPGGRRTVLKKIDSDCLLQGSLHPHVRDRLGRVRELAHGTVANLFGVERGGDDAYLLWEYVEGMPFDAYAGSDCTPREVATAARKLVLAVDLLHMQGIVHGALISGNVIVGPSGAIRLTHISPLLYTDPLVDKQCVWDLLEHAAEQLGERGAALAELVSQGRREGVALRELSTRLGALIHSGDARKTSEPEMPLSTAPRRRALLGAALAAVAGIAIAWGVWHALDGSHLVPEILKHPAQSSADR